MLRQSALALVVLMIGSVAFASSGVASHDDAQSVPSIGQLIWQESEREAAQASSSHARSASHPQPLPLPPADMIGAAKTALTVELHGGRSVAQWTDAADAHRLLALRGEPRSADLATEVLRLAALAGAPEDAAAVQTSADAVPADVRAPFAALVATVADAYEAQAALAGSTMFTDAQRDASFARAEAILAAMNDFRAAVPLPSAPMAAPLFADPAGLVILGDQTDDTYFPTGTLKDPILLVDLGGDDTYYTTAGGACASNLFHSCNMLAVSVLLDISGSDHYTYDGAPNAVQGAGSVGGLGILADVQGDDVYSSTMTRTTSGPFGGVLGYTDGGAQGMSNAGVGILVDGLGNDVYRADVASTAGRSIWNFAQGWGGNGGLAISSDGSGDDWWVSHGLGITKTGGCVVNNRDTCGFQGVYTDGVGFFGGIGIMTDTGAGRDHYKLYDNATTTDFYSVGFGAFGGTGIFFEDGGDDDYVAGHVAQKPFIVPLLNCAFGTGSLGGAGIFLEMGGDDQYVGFSGAPGKSYVMNEGFGGIGAGYGLFVDMSGDDGHFMRNYAADGTSPNTHPQSDTFGRGILLEHSSPLSGVNTNGDGGANRFGNYLDLGGSDTYVGAPPSADGGTWSGGADVNAVPSTLLLEVLQ
ncbi:MAG TPA: hypothetical protein VM370_13220 [Candidatus Thermoplasmatota archaeon]|nr:hypothetical protein [Candidatus Thermoplasmatota archaeon]